VPAEQNMLQLVKLSLLLICHSGLDPESSAVLKFSDSGCRIKSGMTVRNETLFGL
jgi:hypothetical protein